MSVNSEPRWVKIGQIANDLGVGDHVIRHYTEKLKDVLGDNIQLDPASKHTLYNEEAVRLLTLTRKMVAEDKLTLAQVEAELKRAAKSSVPMASKTQLDILNAYSQVINRLDTLGQGFERFERVFEAMADRMRVLDDIKHLPLAISTLQDDLRDLDVKTLLKEINKEKAIVETVRETNEELMKKLRESEQREKELKEILEETRQKVDGQNEEMSIKLDAAVSRMLEEGEKRWATAKVPEKKERGLAAAIRVLFGKS